MIHAVIELGERRVHEVMVPRIDIVGMRPMRPSTTRCDRIIDEGHSRLPVWEGSVDQIVGILYAKDLLPFLKAASGERPAIRALLRPPVFVPESMSIDDLLHEFQRRKVHIAIVLDEYGGTAGLVTIEDLLEEIVGEIQDEYDVEEPMVVRLDDDRFASTAGHPSTRSATSGTTSTSTRSSRTATSTTRSAAWSSTGSAACRGRATRS